MSAHDVGRPSFDRRAARRWPEVGPRRRTVIMTRRRAPHRPYVGPLPDRWVNDVISTSCWSTSIPAAGKKLGWKRFWGFRFLKVFKKFFLRFLRFLKFSLYADRTRKYDPKTSGLYKHRILLKTNLQWAKDKNTMWKNDDEIHESHKSQLKLEYELYLVNYTINFF